MPDIFISYSTNDEPFAQFLHQHLRAEGLDVFMASVSLLPGQRWAPEILGALKASAWVLFLASRAACASPYVQQELGAALITEKKLVPIVWDLPPSQLPGWLNQIQALNLAGATVQEVHAQIASITAHIKSDKFIGQLIGGLAIAGVIYAIAKGSS